MAKRGGFPGGGMPGNMNNLMKQAQRMQRQMEETSKELEEKEYTASAGGGAVTVPENIGVMRQNGRLIYLRRPLEELPIEGRPVSQSRPLEELFAQRRPLYEGAADITVDNVQVEQAAADIWKEWTR